MRGTIGAGLGLCAAVVVLAVGATAAPETNVASTAPPQGASLTLGGDVVLTLRATAGGMTPPQRVEVIDGRVSDLLGIPNIKPSDVTVYTPFGKAPVIYALGRRLITVDAATATAEGEGKKPLELAQMWAKKLQQVLPRVNYRPSNQPEPVIPAHPPLTVTADLSMVGGNTGYVSLRNKVVFKISGPQSGGLTAQERALLLTRRLQVAANKLPSVSATDISISPVPGATTAPKNEAAQQISVGTTPIIAVDAAQAKASGYKSAEQLADVWAKNVRTALGLTDTVSPAVGTPPPSVVPEAPAAPAPPVTAGGA